MSRWTKKDAIGRMRTNARLQTILQIEPQLYAILLDAMTQRRGKLYSRVSTYIALRNQALRYVGWYAEHAELRNADDYKLFIDTIADLLPPDEFDIA